MVLLLACVLWYPSTPFGSLVKLPPKGYPKDLKTKAGRLLLNLDVGPDSIYHSSVAPSQAWVAVLPLRRSQPQHSRAGVGGLIYTRRELFGRKQILHGATGVEPRPELGTGRENIALISRVSMSQACACVSKRGSVRAPQKLGGVPLVHV